MNVITFASRKGGSGKSTLAAHLAAIANKPSRPCLLIDADPQGSLTLWNRLRRTDALAIKNGTRGVAEIVKAAKRDGCEWVLIDTPPLMSAVVTDAIRCATLVVIPARATIFDLTAVRETIDVCRQLRKPYAVAFNAAPVKRNDMESPIVAQARQGLIRLGVPLWGGQTTNRSSFSFALASGEGVKEFAEESLAAAEMNALWGAIEKSVKAIHGAYSAANTMHQRAAA
jgi:chromosome partitioning protein